MTDAIAATGAPAWPWAGLLLLGALHGVNPGMGWLFAVALGLQERSRRAVWGALGPLALGHALALAAALAVAVLLGLVLPARALRWTVAAALALTGARALVRHGHARWMGMRVGARELTGWSFLMATAHGAGLMVLPLVLPAMPAPAAGAHAPHAAHALHASIGAAGLAPAHANAVLLAALVHAAGYLLVTGCVAVLVYERLGLRLLRTAWINLDAIWAAALVATGVLTLVLS